MDFERNDNHPGGMDGYIPEIHLEDNPAQPDTAVPSETHEAPPNPGSHVTHLSSLDAEGAEIDASGDAPYIPGPVQELPVQADTSEADETQEAQDSPSMAIFDTPEEAAPDTESTQPCIASIDQGGESAPDPKTKRKKLLFTCLTALFAVLAIGVISVVGYVYFVINPYASYDKIMPNVYCAGVNLGGMTVAEAQEAIEEALRYPAYSVRVNLPDASYDFKPSQTGVTLNGDTVASRAYQYGRQDPTAFGMYRSYHACKKTEYHLTADTALEFSREDIQNQATTVFLETYVAPTKSSFIIDQNAHTASITLGVPGRRIEAETVANAVIQAFETLNFSDIELSYDPVEIDMEEVSTLSKMCAGQSASDPTLPTVTADEENHAIIITAGMPGYRMISTDLYDLAAQAVSDGSYGTVTLDLTPVAPEYPNFTDAYNALYCEPTEPYYYYGEVYEGISGYSLDIDASIQAVLDMQYGETITLAMDETKPNKTAEEVRAVLFRDQLSSFSTPHVANSNRTNNLVLACQAINGTVLNPGEEFSFNGVVGERTADKGYKGATVYVGGKSVEELGGGICQVASTIYDAVLYAELEVTDRDCHMYFVTYVEGGLDATVYWGAQDFCFRNNTEYPVRINAWVSGGYVHISIDGTKVNDHYVELAGYRLSSTPYSTITEYSSSLPAGVTKETVSPYTGYVYEAYQYVYDGSGNLLESNYLGKSTYKKRDQVITVGTG